MYILKEFGHQLRGAIRRIGVGDVHSFFQIFRGELTTAAAKAKTKVQCKINKRGRELVLMLMHPCPGYSLATNIGGKVL